MASVGRIRIVGRITNPTRLAILRPFQKIKSLFDGLKAAAQASSSRESIACSGLSRPGGMPFHPTWHYPQAERDNPRPFVEEHGITFPILMEADQLLTIAYNARSLPQTYIIAPDGTVALRVVGAVEPERFDPWLDEHGVTLK